MSLILRGGKIIDGTGSPARTGDVLIVDDRIAEVGTVSSGSDSRVIDVSGMTVVPGLIDCHVHITLGDTRVEPRSWTGFSTFMTEQEAGFLSETSSAAREVAQGYHNGRETLRAGFTTVRDVGVGTGYSDIVLREAVANGFMTGPRILACGGGIAMTGGHGWDLGVVEADGVEALRALTRKQLKAGADLIKIFASRAGLSGEEPGGPEFTIEEIRVICDEARQRGKHTAAHAVGTEGIRRAVLAGVDTVEHGCFLDEECATLMAERGTVLVSTLHPYDRQAELCTKIGYPPYAATRSREIMDVYPERIRLALEHGVRVVLGSDSGIPQLTPHGENAREIWLFAELVGASAVDAIHRATGAAATAIHAGTDLGTIAPGKRADIAVFAADLEADLKRIMDRDAVRHVIRNGRLLIEQGQFTA